MTNIVPAQECPICNKLSEACSTTSNDSPDTSYEGAKTRLFCPLCGAYEISQVAEQDMRLKISEKPSLQPIISYTIRQMQKANEYPFINSDMLERIINETILPRPQEQLDNLILWLGQQLDSPGKGTYIKYDLLPAIIGSPDADTVIFVLQALEKKGLIPENRLGIGMAADVKLTFDGWERYEVLKRTFSINRMAFMAMPFSFESLNKMYIECFKPAVTQTGFELRRVDEEAPAGLIDNRIREEILKARFIIADLTEDNSGAYWEAGYAEGLNRPVIYTCEKAYYDSHKTHFDANHCHTIIWDANNKDKANKDLKATIRSTLRSEAKLTDE